MKQIIDEAYKLYMPQIRSEIEQLYNFVENHRGFTKTSESYNILEIGTKFGGTFYLWATLNQSSGMNISIDMNDGGQHGGISNDEMDKRDSWFQERFNNVYFIRSDSHISDTEARCIKLLEGKSNTIDFLFIDGDHTYEGVKQDFDMYSPFVKPGGIICFHDIVDSQRHRDRNVYVSKFWNEIKTKYEYREFVEPGNDWGGIGVIVK